MLRTLSNDKAHGGSHCVLNRVRKWVDQVNAARFEISDVPRRHCQSIALSERGYLTVGNAHRPPQLLSRPHDLAVNASGRFIVVDNTLHQGLDNELLKFIVKSRPAYIVRQNRQSAGNFPNRDCLHVECARFLRVEPIQNDRSRRYLHHFGDDVRVQENHSDRSTGSCGVLAGS